jgi:hypothetical protein
LFDLIDMKEFRLLLLFAAVLICLFQPFDTNSHLFNAQGQTLQQPESKLQHQTSPSFHPAVAVKITSPTASQNVSTGQLTITGTSTDTPTSKCQVYADWNDRKPFQRAVAAGPAGNGDYSRWKYTYTATYHEITNGTNELTSKISCLASPTNLTKWYSVNVTGVEGLNPQTNVSLASVSQVQSNNSDNPNNFASPLSTTRATEITPPRSGASIDSGDSRSEPKDDDGNDDNNNDQREEESDGKSHDFTDEEQNVDDYDNENKELVSTNEDNQDEDEEGDNLFDDRRNYHFTDEEQNVDDYDNENKELFSTNEDNQDEDEEEVNLFDDDLGEDFNEQIEEENGESPKEDNGNSLGQVIDRGDERSEEELEKNDINTLFDSLFELSIPTIQSIPSLLALTK